MRDEAAEIWKMIEEETANTTDWWKRGEELMDSEVARTRISILEQRVGAHRSPSHAASITRCFYHALSPSRAVSITRRLHHTLSSSCAQITSLEWEISQLKEELKQAKDTIERLINVNERLQRNQSAPTLPPPHMPPVQF